MDVINDSSVAQPAEDQVYVAIVYDGEKHHSFLLGDGGGHWNQVLKGRQHMMVLATIVLFSVWRGLVVLLLHVVVRDCACSCRHRANHNLVQVKPPHDQDVDCRQTKEDEEGANLDWSDPHICRCCRVCDGPLLIRHHNEQYETRQWRTSQAHYSTSQWRTSQAHYATSQWRTRQARYATLQWQTSQAYCVTLQWWTSQAHYAISRWQTNITHYAPL